MAYSSKNNKIFYAVVIDTAGGESLPDIGLNDGVFRLVSDGCSMEHVVDENGTFIPHADLYEDFLSKDSGITAAGQRINIETSGDFAYLATFDCTIVNQSKSGVAFNEMLNKLQSDDTWVIGASVTFYAVINDVAYTRWSGIVANILFNEKTLTFSCQDKLQRDFANIGDDEDNLVLGNVAFVPLVEDTEEFKTYYSNTVSRITFDEEKSYPYQIGRRADQRIYNGRIGWHSRRYNDPDNPIREQSSSDPLYDATLFTYGDVVVSMPRNTGLPVEEFVGKTLNLDNVKALINSADNVVVDGRLELELRCRVYEELNQDGVFGNARIWKPSSDQGSTTVWLDEDFRKVVFDRLRVWDREKFTATITNDIKAFKIADNVDISKIEKDDNGNIIFYSYDSDTEQYIKVSIAGFIDEEHRILINTQDTYDEIIYPDQIMVNAIDWTQPRDEDRGKQPNYTKDEFGDWDYEVESKNNTPVTGGTWLADRNKRHVNPSEFNRTANRQSAGFEISLVKDRINKVWHSYTIDNVDKYSDLVPGFAIGPSDIGYYQNIINEFRNACAYMGRSLDEGVESGDGWKEKWFLRREPGKTVAKYPPRDFDRDGDWVYYAVPEFLPCTAVCTETYVMVNESNFGWLSLNTPERESPDDIISPSHQKFLTPSYTGEAAYDIQPDSVYAGAPASLREAYNVTPACFPVVTNIPEGLLPIPRDNHVDVTVPYVSRNWTAPGVSNVTRNELELGINVKVERQVGKPAYFWSTVGKDRVTNEERRYDHYDNSNAVISEYNESQSALDERDVKRAMDGKKLMLMTDITAMLDNDQDVRVFWSRDTAIHNPSSPGKHVVDFTSGQTVTTGLMVHKVCLIGKVRVDFNRLFVKVEEPSDVQQSSNTVAGVIDYLVKTHSELEYSGNIHKTRGDNINSIWNTGFIINRRDNVFSYLTDLLRQSFVAGYTDRFGNLVFKAWREEDEFDEVSHDNHIVIRNSIRNIRMTELTNVFNNIKVEYNYDHGRGEFLGSYSINDVDKETTFPPQSDDKWKKMVTGILDYPLAKELWDLSRSNYLMNRTVNTLPANLSELRWASDLQHLGLPSRKYEEYAVNYLRNSIEWNTKQKYIIEYTIPVNDATAKLDFMQSVYFTDSIITPPIDGQPQYAKGWVVGLQLDANRNVYDVTLLFEKFGYRLPPMFDDRGITITETLNSGMPIITETLNGEDINISESSNV